MAFARLRGLSLGLAVCSVAVVASAQTLPLRAIWYRPSDGCLFKRLADDHVPPPELGTESPRIIALRTLEQNFYGWYQLGANAVIVFVSEEDANGNGCGFPYDPVHRPCNLNNGTCTYPAMEGKYFSVAQELFISMAAKYNLKVIFVLAFSGYHMEMDPLNPPNLSCPSSGACDTYGNASNPAGAWDFIHSVIDPPAYYGQLSTTAPSGNAALSLFGLQDHLTTDYFADTRVAGWLLGKEWRFSLQKEMNFLSKYWGYFYNLVHWPGSVGQFAGLYMIGGPDAFRTDNRPGYCTASPLPNAQDFYDFKSWIFNQSVKPDVYGLEWYGNSWANYNMDCIGNDMASMVSYLISDPPNDPNHPISASQIFWAEGGSDQLSNQTAWANFYTNGINAAASIGSAGLAVWSSDQLNNIPGTYPTGCYFDYLPGLTDPPATLFYVNHPITNNSSYSYGLPVFCGPSVQSAYQDGGYPPSSFGWHWWHSDTGTYSCEAGCGNPACPGSCYSVPATVGPIWFADRTAAGNAVAAAFAAHM